MKNKKSSVKINLNNKTDINNKFNKIYTSNRLMGKYPYAIEDGLYVRVLGLNKSKIHYLTHQQAKEVNNLIKAKHFIDIEIKNILKGLSKTSVNIKDFDVASGQVIIKLSKSKSENHKVQIVDHKTQNNYLVEQSSWYNKNDEYKFRYNGCSISKQILDKVDVKKDKTILQLFPNKNLRTCVMLLDMEDKFTFIDKGYREENLMYPYYQGSKALSEKYGKLDYKKYFFYNKPLQDSINDELKIELIKQGVKNKKRLGLGETIIYDNPKLFIRQSAKEIVATIDLVKSSANNSLYVFSLRDNSEKTIDFLYFLCGFLNTNFITYYAQQMNIIRFSQGKQPQIKIGDLGTIYIPNDNDLQSEISVLCKEIYNNPDSKERISAKIDNLIYAYYYLSDTEINNIEQSIKEF